MKAKEFIIEYKKDSKPRNFVAKNAKMGGAGQHKDKKKAEKQGDVKHKTKQYAEDAVADFLARGGEIQHGKFRKPRKSEKTDYGSKHIGGQRDAVAGKAGKTLGRAAATNFKGGGKPVVGSSYRGEGVAEGAPGNDFRVGQRVIYKTSQGQQFPSIVTAVDFDEDAVKIKSANNKPFPNSGGDIEMVVDPGWKFLTVEPRVDPDSIIAVSPNMRKTTERVRDPEDWDEGNTEPPNNFAVYINGKKWKVFKGRGYYADDYREKQHYQQLKTWAQQKSAQSGKKWEVYVTGEAPTE